MIPKEIYEALETIKNECDSHDDCKECPLYKEHFGCGIEMNPYAWILNKEEM